MTQQKRDELLRVAKPVNLCPWELEALNDELHPLQELRFPDGKNSEAPYRAGDILYVMEPCFRYQKDQEISGHEYGYPLRPSKCAGCASGRKPVARYSARRMPKRAARMFLAVKSVHMEALQDITVEGCARSGIWDDYVASSQKHHDVLAKLAYPTVFSELWDMDHKGAEAWECNPWVWVVAFDVIEAMPGV